MYCTLLREITRSESCVQDKIMWLGAYGECIRQLRRRLKIASTAIEYPRACWGIRVALWAPSLIWLKHEPGLLLLRNLMIVYNDTQRNTCASAFQWIWINMKNDCTNKLSKSIVQRFARRRGNERFLRALNARTFLIWVTRAFAIPRTYMSLT